MKSLYKKLAIEKGTTSKFYTNCFLSDVANNSSTTATINRQVLIIAFLYSLFSAKAPGKLFQRSYSTLFTKNYLKITGEKSGKTYKNS